MNKKVIALFMFLLITTTISWANESEQKAKPANTIDCSIINLIATPEKYHNKLVRVIGFVVIEFEH